MATETDRSTQRRTSLSRARVLQAGVQLADKGGIGALSMRRLAQGLGVEAMSLFYHVDSKEALLDGLVEVVLDEIEEAVGGFDVPANGADWKTSNDLARHALHALGSRALGFSQELFAPADEDQAMAMLEEMADQIPHLVGMMTEVAHDDPDSTLGWCDDQYEFESGLDLILDGLDRLREQG